MHMLKSFEQQNMVSASHHIGPEPDTARSSSIKTSTLMIVPDNPSTLCHHAPCPWRHAPTPANPKPPLTLTAERRSVQHELAPRIHSTQPCSVVVVESSR